MAGRVALRRRRRGLEWVMLGWQTGNTAQDRVRRVSQSCGCGPRPPAEVTGSSILGAACGDGKNLPGRRMSTPTNEARPDTTNVPVPWAGKRRYFDLLLGASCVILIIRILRPRRVLSLGRCRSSSRRSRTATSSPVTAVSSCTRWPMYSAMCSLRCTGLSALAGLLSPRLWRRRSLPDASC